MRNAIPAKPAATVILLRPAQPSGFEVYLTRRPGSMAFLGGMYVFPGGNVQKDDCAPVILARCHGLSAARARKMLGSYLRPEVALGHWVAVIRELYEETGILLATPRDGGQLTDATMVRFGPKKTSLLANTLRFASIVEEEDLVCDLSRIVYFSRWKTPRQLAMRFDTRFFLASLPPGQTPAPNPAEVADSVWLTPDQALKLFSREQLPMIFPTFASLRTLADFDSIDSVFNEFARRLEG